MPTTPSFKAFAAPTFSKILIAILLLLLTYFIPRYGPACASSSSGGTYQCVFRPVAGLGYPTFYGEHFMNDQAVWQFSVGPLIFDLFLAYALACAAVWGREKRPRKRVPGYSENETPP